MSHPAPDAAWDLPVAPLPELGTVGPPVEPPPSEVVAIVLGPGDPITLHADGRWEFAPDLVIYDARGDQ